MQNKRLIKIIYNAKFYEWPQKDIKIMLLLLMRSQNIKDLWIGPFAPLNFETATDVSIYFKLYYGLHRKKGGWVVVLLIDS